MVGAAVTGAAVDGAALRSRVAPMVVVASVFVPFLKQQHFKQTTSKKDFIKYITGIGRKNETEFYIFTILTNSLKHLKLCTQSVHNCKTVERWKVEFGCPYFF